jgi:hypothetical protein
MLSVRTQLRMWGHGRLDGLWRSIMTGCSGGAHDHGQPAKWGMPEGVPILGGVDNSKEALREA